MNNQAIQSLRLYIETRKREIEHAEKKYDVKCAVKLLEELALPLTQPHQFDSSWKNLYFEYFYRDMIKFLFTFVVVNLEVSFNATQRQVAFHVFFDRQYVPVVKSFSAITAQLVHTQSSHRSGGSEEEKRVILVQCVHVLEMVLGTGGLSCAVKEMFLKEQTAPNQVATIYQPLIVSLCSIPDLIFNRLQRKTPEFFQQRTYLSELCNAILSTTIDQAEKNHPTYSIFRLFTDKLTRTGHTATLIRIWLQRKDLYDTCMNSVHSTLLSSLSPAAQEHVLVHLTTTTGAPPISPPLSTASSPNYLLLSLLPSSLLMLSTFQYVITHKIILTKAVKDVLVHRMLVDVLGCRDEMKPLCSTFEVVLSHWSRDTFAHSTDYQLNASICLFLRCAMRKFETSVFQANQTWVAKLCKGVQHHMAHSNARVRELGMRVGESVSRIISPENVLEFEYIDGAMDVLDLYMAVPFDFQIPPESLTEKKEREQFEAFPDGEKDFTEPKYSIAKPTQRVVTVDPNQIIDSSDEDEENEDELDESGDDDSDLEPYDLNDNEQDLETPRPLYLKDLISGLLVEDNSDQTEAALAQAEVLLRKKPRDLHHNAKNVVVALLRLEDKYSTPHFEQLRAQALASACALSPRQVIPYLQTQALEPEQLFQSRLDILQAMTVAAEELSETGAFRIHNAKRLLHESINSSEMLEKQTMERLKTRRFGYQRDPLAPPKKNAFADYALLFFSPLLYGYIEYNRKQGSNVVKKTDIDELFLAHLLHSLARFVECAGHSPVTIPMAKCLLEFAWHQRTNIVPAVRRQVLFAISRVHLVVPPYLLQQEMGSNIFMEMNKWLYDTTRHDVDDGCREAARLLMSMNGRLSLST